MKTKEIRERLRTMGYERGTLYCLEAQNEMLLQTRRDLNELAVMFSKMVDSMDGMMAVAGRMKETIQHMNGEQAEEDTVDQNTNSLDKKDMQ